ncbi:MAG: rhodanese-like domain-containing protein [Cyclobacteriaceae bacterium]
MNQDVTCEQIKQRLESGEKFHFIDVREEWEHEEQNIGAKCFPLGDLPTKLTVLERLKSEEIIVHCNTGPRGNRAKKYLISQGFNNVRNMLGGITEFMAIQEAQQQEAEG